MKSFYVIACMSLFVLGCSKVDTGKEVSSSPEVLSSLTEISIYGYLFEDLLSDNPQLPASINGAPVRYYSGSDTYISGASQQVQVQFSKMGLNIPASIVELKLANFENMTMSEDFGQTNFNWSKGGIKCYLSVELGDDTFELSCWR